jgi:5-methylcytosine-specific restriction endonuclease McrA
MMTKHPLPKPLKRLSRAQVRFIQLIRTGFKCAYCGMDFMQSFEAFSNATVDHFKPTSKGGENSPHNKLACCSLCNRLKSNSVFETFAEAKAEVLKRREEFFEDYSRLLFVAHKMPAAVHHEQAGEIIRELYQREAIEA